MSKDHSFMATKTGQAKNHKGKVNFDFTKTWYLLPWDPEDHFFGSMYEGKILHDKSAIGEKIMGKARSRIRIADLVGIFREFSEPFVYPVKIDSNSNVESAGNGSWYANNVQILAPVNCWDLFLKLDNIFTGTMNLDGQPYIPQGLLFPAVIYGDLIFNHSILPEKTQLPGVIKGEFKIQFCNIPPTWEIPRTINKFTLIASSFGSNIDFAQISVSTLRIEGCVHATSLSFPAVFPGHLDLWMINIDKSFQLPAEVGELSISEANVEQGAILPAGIAGNFTLAGVKLSPNIFMPRSCRKFSAIECTFPVDFRLPADGLEEAQFINCKLPKNFKISTSHLKQLSFNEMEIPEGFGLPDKFNGSLEFECCKLPGSLILPKMIKGQLKLMFTTMAGPVKLPSEKEIKIIMNEGADLENLIATAAVKKRITFTRLVDPERSNDDGLPF